MNQELKDMMLKMLLSDVAQPAQAQCFWKVGECYFIRTVTMYCLGRLKAVIDNELLMESASWVADCGRFHEAQKTGKLNEVEPFVNDVIVNRSSIIDATVWSHALPTGVIE